ncbi:MAG: DUF1553 domain-containing protein [Planctomycetaceae bacterium]
MISMPCRQTINVGCRAVGSQVLGGLCAVAMFWQACPAWADPTPQAPLNLERQALAILRTRCVECHSGEAPDGGLRLSTWEEVARGNKRGQVVFPGVPGSSLLWEMVAERKMPPEEPLEPEERAVLLDWISRGAAGLPAIEPAHWAFRPLRAPPVPVAPALVNARNRIDRFLAAALAERGLAFRDEAPQTTLIRRVCFDLTGVPPTLDEIDTFLADKSPIAYEAMVDRYLASPRYGERWGKYWLDVVGYADSNGYFAADSDRPHAYRYRDYVIASLNSDKPYDRFVMEQLAGDALAGYTPDGDVTPAMVELLTATHFLRNAQDGSGESDGNPDEVLNDRFAALEGSLQITINALLGLTIQCAKCHSHKFEPISQEEYYGLQAILFAAYLPDQWVKPNDRIVMVASRAERDAYRKATEQVDRQISGCRASLEQVVAPLREEVVEARLAGKPADLLAAVRQALRKPAAERSLEQALLLAEQVDPLNITLDVLAQRFTELASVRDDIQQALAAAEKLRPAPLETLAVLTDVTPEPPPHHVLLRGQPRSPGPEVAPGVLRVLASAENLFQVDPALKNTSNSGRRLAFARWVTSPGNPLFARTMANRVWQHHFGAGLVSTPDNLGQSGAAPTNAALLDFLATEFIASGWRLKSLHRLILSSAVYRQASDFDAAAQRTDPTNRLLWRFPLRRLDAEAIRDGMLAASGAIDDLAGGTYVPTQWSAEGGVTTGTSVAGGRRRSVYLQQRRTQPLTFLEVFDAPAIVTNCSGRSTSTAPQQSLELLNSEFARACATSLAEQVALAVGDRDAPFIQRAYRLACGREPTPREESASRGFLSQQAEYYAGDSDPGRRARVDFCQMLLASNAFLYLE